MKSTGKLIGILIVVAGVVYFFKEHSGFFKYSHQPRQYMPNMHRTDALKPQRGYAFYEDFSSSRMPPAGAVARGVEPYKYKGAEYLAENVDKFSNPLPVTRSSVMRGKFIYQNNCYVCHGKDGNGNGPVVGAFANPPSLNSDKIRAYADSQIYHVIVNGQNTMGSYAAQVRSQDRWAVVHYIRVLQLADRPGSGDLDAFDSMVNKEAR